MSDFYEHALAELREELAHAVTGLTNVGLELDKKREHIGELLEKINGLGGKAATLRQTVEEMGPEIVDLRQTVYDLRRYQHTLLVQIHNMRNCDNCNEVGCANGALHRRGENCADTGLPLWEYKT